MTAHVLSHSENAGVSFSNLGALLGSGLTLFFALSGFLLYRPFAAAIVRDEKNPLVGAYLTNRALRIMPAYWAILIIVTAVGASNVTPDTIGHLWTDPLKFLATLGLVQGYFPGTGITGIGPAWSLGAEIAFYLTLPILAVITARAVRGRSRTTRLIGALMPGLVLIIVGAVGNAWAAHTVHPGPLYPQQWEANWHSVLERSFLPSAALFAPGMLAAVVVVARDAGLEFRLPRRAGFGIAAVLLAILMMVADHERIDARLFNFGMAIASGLAILYVSVPSEEPPNRPLRLLENRLVVYLGTISYSMYLWHEPVIKWLHDHRLTLEGRPEVVVNVLVIWIVVSCLASLTYRFVERPANAHKRSMTSRGDTEAVRFADFAASEAAP